MRLSYALSDWVELANQYPPALVALKAIRDAKSDRLARGDGDRRLFHDVRAINEQLDQQGSTYELFVGRQEANPALAEECADLAMAAIVGAKDFDLAPCRASRCRRLASARSSPAIFSTSLFST